MDTIKQLDNEKLTSRVELERKQEETKRRVENIVVLKSSTDRVAKIEKDMLPCRPHARTYTLYLREQWYKFQIHKIVEYLLF